VNLKKENVPTNATADAIHSILLKAREDRIDSLAQSTLKILDEADKKHDKV
jgi:RecB family exonuclease